MALDYFYGQAVELFSFYRIPKALFQEPRFQSLSTDAKILYGILLDRMSLSAKNGWLDEQGRVFIIFTIEDVKRALCCADNKATKLLRELEEFGLIERKRRGLGKPSLVYVKNFSAESSKSIFQNRDFHDSGGFKSASQDPAKPRCNKTEENNTEMSETYGTGHRQRKIGGQHCSQRHCQFCKEQRARSFDRGRFSFAHKKNCSHTLTEARCLGGAAGFLHIQTEVSQFGIYFEIPTRRHLLRST